MYSIGCEVRVLVSDVKGGVAEVSKATCILLHVLHTVPVVTVSGEKVGYAKKMAQGYLKSVGSGDYTPKYSAYTRENMVNAGEGQPPQPHWTLKDDQGQDEFDF